MWLCMCEITEREEWLLDSLKGGGLSIITNS